MSTDHHLEDNADDQTRAARAAVAAAPPTPSAVRTRHLRSALTDPDVTAACDLPAGTYLTDLVGDPPGALDLEAEDRRHQVVRITAEAIPAGARFEVRSDGRIYAADETAAELAEDLVDVAETAALEDLEAAAAGVDRALAAVAPPTPDYDFAEAIAGMANRHLRDAGLALEVVEACSGCGCTNRRACVLPNPRSIGGGMFVQTCHWTHQPGQPPRCSNCEDGKPPAAHGHEARRR